jgi:hypothetical protein
MNNYISKATVWNNAMIIFSNNNGNKFDRTMSEQDIASIMLKRGTYIFTREANMITAMRKHRREAGTELQAFIVCEDGMGYVNTFLGGRGQEMMANSGKSVLKVERLLDKSGSTIGFRASLFQL